MGWFEAIVIFLLLAILMYLHGIQGVLRSIDERDEVNLQTKKYK